MKLMAKYDAGDFTQREFCEHQQLAYSTFCYWRRRPSLETVRTEPTESLVELPVV